MNVSVFDLHCDTAFELLGRNGLPDKDLSRNDLHIDLERASHFQAYAQCFACYSTTLGDPGATDPVVLFSREVGKMKEQVALYSNKIAFARNGEQIRNNRDNGLISAILTAEGSAGIRFDPEGLYHLKNDGFCIVSLGWNEKNPLTGSHKTGGGLTEQGRRFVRNAQDLGMIIDVSHISDEGFWDIMDITNAPIAATHSNSRTVCDHSRNLTDNMFVEICRTGGIVGINLYTQFLGGSTLDTVCDHIFHYLDLDPDGKHIALGGDLDGCESIPSGFTGVQDYQKLASRLLQRGLPEQMIHDIFWNNALGVIERCCT